MTTDPLVPLRVTAVIVGWSGLAGLFISGDMAPVYALAGVVSAVMTVVCSRYSSPNAKTIRRIIGALVLFPVLLIVASAISQSPEIEELFGVLALLIIGVMTAQSFGLDTRHDLMIAVTIGVFVLVLPTGLAPTPGLLVPMLIGWPAAITALVLSTRAHSTECKSAAVIRTSTPSRPGIVGIVARTVGVVLAIGLLLFLLVPPPKGLPQAGRLGNPVSVLPGSEGGRSLANYGSSGALDMRARGKLPNTPVIDVPADSPRLWRGRFYDTYDGTNWTANETEFGQLGGTGRIRVAMDGGDGVLQADPLRSDDVKGLAGFDQFVVAPGVPVWLTTEGRAAFAGANRIVVEDRSGYTVESVRVAEDPATLSAASGPDRTEPQWLDLPDSLPGRVRRLAEDITAGTTTRYEAVTAITAYLETTKEYDLDSRVPPVGADAVDDFLFNADSGFCEQFAAAQVVLLRTLGIPARMATGLANQGPAAKGRRVLRASNAHAWVEVWYPGVGWSASDPTPPDSATPQGKNGLEELVRKLLRSRVARLALAAVMVVIAGLVFVVMRRRRRRTPTPPFALSTHADALLAAFARLEAALVTDGRPRAPGETLAELERRLGTDPAGRAALAVFERACYSPTQITNAEARAAIDAFERLAGEILAAHAARARLADSIGVPR